MLAPLLLVLAAPVRLLLRAVPPRVGRRVAALLRTPPVRFLTEPVPAAGLNIGGLWVLYGTGLYALTHTDDAVHVLAHLHMFLAGCLFTAAILQVDAAPHTRSFAHRATVLVLALAAHDILAKHLYADPPAGVATAAAARGAVIMYYGGDVVDVTPIVLLCAAWRRAATGTHGPWRSERSRRRTSAPGSSSATRPPGPTFREPSRSADSRWSGRGA